MAEIKTKPSDDDVTEFLNAVEPAVRRDDAFVLVDMMRRVTGAEPRLWGGSMVGFGDWRYVSEKTGRTGDWFSVGFRPAKAKMSIYLTCDLDEHADALSKLGKHTRGVGCLYINKLADVDLNVLESMVERGFAECEAS